MKNKVSKDSHDISAMFLCFVATCGDCERTGLAMDIDPEVVREISEREGWIQKVKKVSLMTTSDKSGDYERGVNRALNFVAGHMMRSVIQKILDTLSKQDGNELLASLASVKAGQVSFSAKFISDLSSALEKVSHITYVALSDSVPERETKKDGSEEMDLQSLHIAVSSALGHSAGAGAERKLLELTVEETVRNTVPPKPL